MAARMPMIATTIISSIRVKPFWTFFMKENSFVGWVRHTTAVCGGLYATAVPLHGPIGPRGELLRAPVDATNPLWNQGIENGPGNSDGGPPATRAQYGQPAICRPPQCRALARKVTQLVTAETRFIG